MRKKVVSVFLVLVMILSVMPTAFAEKITMTEFNNRVNAIQAKYGQGTSVSQIYNSKYDGSACYKDLSGWSSWQCMAWAYYMFDNVWKVSVRSDRTDVHSDVNRLFVGDYVRYRSSDSYDHSIFITKISGNDIYYTDGNGQGTNLIRYNVHTTKSQLQALLNKKLKDEAGNGYIRHSWDNGFKDDPLGNPVNVGDGFYAYIINTKTWKHLTHDSDNNVTARTMTGAQNQIWHFERQSDNSYKIISILDGLSLDDINFGDTNGANVACANYWGGSAQLWYIYGASAEYKIRPKCSKRVLDLNGGSAVDGTNIQIWEFNNTDAQKFQIWKLDAGVGKPELHINSKNNLTTFSWQKVHNATRYDLRLYNGAGEFMTIDYIDGDIEQFQMNLPEGNYSADIAGFNHTFSTWQFSDRVYFTVQYDDTNILSTYTGLIKGDNYELYTKIANLTTSATYAAASYTADGRLLDIRTTELISGARSAQASLPKTDGAKYIKVFLWDSAEAMNPLAECETIIIN